MKSDSASEIRRIIDSEARYVSTSVGSSMKPMLRSRRDTVVISKKPGRLDKYDVALYYSEGKLILHRVIKVLPDGYDIRGDNCFIIEHNIREEQILGILTTFWRGEKKHEVTDFSYRFYSRFWVAAYPVRLLFRYFKVCAKRVFRIKSKPKKDE